jgi:F420-dependent methylenetetrahydromethanopterin dehydrogenase
MLRYNKYQEKLNMTPNRLTYIVIAADPKLKRDREFLKSVREYMKNSPSAK